MLDKVIQANHTLKINVAVYTTGSSFEPSEITKTKAAHGRFVSELVRGRQNLSRCSE